MMVQPAMIDLHPEGARHAVIWLHGLGIPAPASPRW